LAVVCLESIRSDEERMALVRQLQQTGKTILDISLEQTSCFAGNMLELQGHGGQPLMAMSSRAWNSLNADQQRLLQRHARPVTAALDTIEDLGGGGARCMIAEIHLPKRCVA
jgi:hypothetical protein